MFDFQDAGIESLSIHHIGNKVNGGNLKLSKQPSPVGDTHLQHGLLQFALPPLAQPGMYQFISATGDVSLNPVYQLSAEFFQGGSSAHILSVKLAQLLFENTAHPQIKEGDFMVMHLTNLHFENQKTDAIGLFKVEHKDYFLQFDERTDGFDIAYLEGIEMDKLDKGCLILNLDTADGFKVFVTDRSNKGSEAQYWKDQFLMIQPCHDGFHQTRDFLQMTRKFVTDRVPEVFEADKTVQIDMLNRSMEYFKNNESFELENFQNEVFQQPDLIESFKAFDKDYRDAHDIYLDEKFDISDEAVKKQSRVFKSVLKLDKNFHVYIHGNRNMIEKGVDGDGRKFYKIYYEQEG
jgi:hypothetical protein